MWLLALVLMSSVQTANIVKASRPNLLFFMTDDMRAELGCLGDAHVQSPRIDALAKKSLLLANHHVQITVCGPTRASLLVGRRPDTLRTITHTSETYWRLRAGNFSTIPQMLKDNGYHTVSFGKVFDLRTSSVGINDVASLCDAKFSWSEQPVFCGTSTWNEDIKQSQCPPYCPPASHSILDPKDLALYSDNRIVEAAIARLNGSVGGPLPTPWMLAVGVHRPHLPLLVPKQYLDLYPPGSIPFPANFKAPINMPLAATECAGGKCLPGLSSLELWEQYSFNATMPQHWNGWDGNVTESPLSRDLADTLRRYYFAAVSHTDAMLGRMLDAIEALGATNNTVVVFASDHGWHLAQNSFWAKCTLFEAATRTPVLIHVPGVTDAQGQGRVISSLTEHVDVLPTVAAAIGLPVPPLCPPDSSNVTLCREGVNLLPLVDLRVEKLRKATFTQWPHPFTSQTPTAMGYSLRTETWRYTEWVHMSYPQGVHTPNWTAVCSREMYDLYHDPGETRNIVDDPAYQESLHLLRVRLHAGWRLALGNHSWPDLPDVPQTMFQSCPVH